MRGFNSPSRSQEGILGVLKGQLFKSLGKMAKRLDRLGPNCAHIGLCRWIWEWAQVGKHWPVRHQRVHFNPGLSMGNSCGFRRSTFHQKSGYDLQKKTH